MGILFSNNTWRAPLQLIDSWLPTPATHTPPKPAAKVVQLFARAGWLRHPAKNAPATSSTQMTAAPLPCRVRVMRNADSASSCRTDARLVISGRMGDVCAELDRLAALEHQTLRQHA